MSAELQSGLLLLGVGGGGCRLASSVLAAYGGGMRALGVDTDALSNRQSSQGGLNCLLLGGARLAGHGTGGDAIKGRLAAQDDMQNMAPHLQGVRTAVLIACMGGGTGGGATPEIIKMFHDMGVATICFAVLPFGFEGESRRKAAERVLPMIEESTDSLVTVALDDLFGGAAEAGVDAAIRQAEATLAAGVSLLWRLLTKPGFIQMDPERLHALVVRGGNASFGCASACGAGRAGQAVAQLKGCKMLREGEAVSRAGSLLVGILAGPDLRLAEIGEVMEKIRGLCKADSRVEMGTVLDASREGSLDVVVLAFESGSAPAAVEVRKESSPPVAEPPVAEVFPIQSGARKGRGAKVSKLSFGTTGRGKFQNVEPTIFDGQDLDIPAFVRRGILLER